MDSKRKSPHNGCRSSIVRCFSWRTRRLRFEPLFQTLPDLEILFIQLRGFQRKFRRPANEARFKHECQSISQIYRLQLRGAGAFEGRGVRTMSGHAVMKAGASRDEAFRFRVIGPADQAHELAHEVTMEPRRTKRM